MISFFFFFNDTATTEIYTLSYTTLFRSLAANEPVISVDTKKKELVGNFKNNGREWHPKAAPEAVNVHDFIDPKLGRAIPYGIYDIADNKGWVSVDRKSTRLNSSHSQISYAVFCLKKKTRQNFHYLSRSPLSVSYRPLVATIPTPSSHASPGSWARRLRRSCSLRYDIRPMTTTHPT